MLLTQLKVHDFQGIQDQVLIFLNLSHFGISSKLQNGRNFGAQYVPAVRVSSL